MSIKYILDILYCIIQNKILMHVEYINYQYLRYEVFKLRICVCIKLWICNTGFFSEMRAQEIYFQDPPPPHRDPKENVHTITPRYVKDIDRNVVMKFSMSQF